MRSDAVALTGSRARTRDFVALAKPRLNVLVVASTLAGGYARKVEDTVTIHCNTAKAMASVSSR